MKNRNPWRWIPALLLGLCIVGVIAAFLFLRTQVNIAGWIDPAGVAQVQVPPGFTVNVFASGLNNPRDMAFGPDGVLYVANRFAGQIVSLPDSNADGVADTTRVFAGGLNSPSSVAYHEGAWFVGVPTGVIRLEDADGDGQAETSTTLVDSFPTAGAHITRTVLFLPDGRMVVSVGSSCNVCNEDDPRRAAIVVYDGPAAGGEAIYASGLRNAVGLALHPETGQVWATNNGRDLMGDDLPPETVYQVEEATDYGWPRCHAGDIVDPEFGFEGACAGVPQPAVEMQAHMAPLGLAFYTGDRFPPDYRGDLFIALHGSWNRSVPAGYKVMRVPFDGSGPAGPAEEFAFGWLDESTGNVQGRPAGVAVGPDGALYVSDDKGGFIYRIFYSGD
jgi:glucose/arabinose dehydrogenase